MQVRFQVLTAASMKMPVFCDVAPCSLETFTDVTEFLTIIRPMNHHLSDYTTQHPRRQPSLNDVVHFVQYLLCFQISSIQQVTPNTKIH
jgi:hypothetical protein